MLDHWIIGMPGNGGVDDLTSAGGARDFGRWPRSMPPSPIDETAADAAP